MKTSANLRQQRWRKRQSVQGLVQVRSWVPEPCAAELRAIATAMRIGEVAQPSTAKQQYEAKRAARQLDVPLPGADVYGDFRRLELWLALHPRPQRDAG